LIFDKNIKKIFNFKLQKFYFFENPGLFRFNRFNRFTKPPLEVAAEGRRALFFLHALGVYFGHLQLGPGPLLADFDERHADEKHGDAKFEKTKPEPQAVVGAGKRGFFFLGHGNSCVREWRSARTCAEAAYFSITNLMMRVFVSPLRKMV
jgi:hypothetical protein